MKVHFKQKIRQIKMVVSNHLFYPFLLLLFSATILPFLNIFTKEPFELETSVWCLKGLNESNLCKFKNICYNPQFHTFSFFLGKGSVIKGLSHYSELQKIQLSSVQHHNQFYANLAITDTETYKLAKQIKIYSKALALARFKPNNIMHSIHDDIFPAFLTIESSCAGDLKCMESYDLLFHDNHPEGPFINLYQLFSRQFPMLLSKINSDSDFILCFKELLTGLVLNGIVYQYGFKKPHGPITPSQLSQSDVSRFTSFLKRKLLIPKEVDKSYNVLLLSRQKSRRILNISELKQMVKDAYQRLNREVTIHIINLDLFSNDLTALIKMISQADGLIGMHGAELILSLFLKPKSFVVEIFPFAIKPEIVSFLRPISELDGSNFMYFSWRNMLRNNSVPHPDAHPLLGGISHLDKATQMKIRNSLEVPAVHCCNNPLFLYHMYQDTYISTQFGNFLYESFSEALTSQRESGEFKEKWFYPHTVYNVTCNYQLEKKILHIGWQPPFNVETNLKYSLFVKDQSGILKKEFSTEKPMLDVEVPFEGNPKFEVWISAYLTSNNFKGPDLYINCN